MNLTPEERRHFQESNICHICEKEILENEEKVADHDHLTGKFRDSAHKACNLNFRKNYAIAVCFHNFTNYDLSFFIKDVATRIDRQIAIIPRNISKYFAVIKICRKYGNTISIY